MITIKQWVHKNLVNRILFLVTGVIILQCLATFFVVQKIHKQKDIELENAAIIFGMNYYNHNRANLDAHALLIKDSYQAEFIGICDNNSNLEVPFFNFVNKCSEPSPFYIKVIEKPIYKGTNFLKLVVWFPISVYLSSLLPYFVILLFLIIVMIFSLYIFYKRIDTDIVVSINHLLDNDVPPIIAELHDLKTEIMNLNKKIIESSKLTAIGQTTTILAHDIRRPFSQIKGILSVLNQIKNDPVSINLAMKEIDDSVEHVESMLSDIVNFSREVIVQSEAVSIPNIIDFSIRQLSQVCTQKEITFEYSISNNKKLMADYNKLSRVFINIILNAIEAIKEKGIIRISCSDISIDNKDEIQIIISNNGPLIQEEYLTKIFDPFFTKNKNKGTGLGLASAQKIVNLHGGVIKARNNMNNNTVEFIIVIPASKEKDDYSLGSLPSKVNCVIFPNLKKDKQQVEDMISNFIKLGYNFKILLLEDEPLYRASIKNTIKQIPELSALITLYDAINYDEAVTLIRHEKITHAIVDIDLGEEKTGFDFLQEVHSSGKKINLMVHSNRHLDAFRQQSFELGAKAFVSKPLSLDNLLDFLDDNRDVL